MKKLTTAAAAALMAGMIIGSVPSFASGNISMDTVYSSDKLSQPLSTTSVYAGTGEFNDEDGKLLQSSFRLPQSILSLPDGSLLVADSRNHLIRKLSGDETTVWAGFNLIRNQLGFPEGGYLDGAADQSAFNHPEGLAIDGKGNVYVADSQNHAIRKIDTNGKVTTFAGEAGIPGHKDGKGSAARFNLPKDVVVTPDGTVYVADTLNHALRKIAADGTVTTLNALSTRTVEHVKGKKLAAGDFADGDLLQAKFNEPSGITADAKGNLIISDTGNQRIRYVDLSAGKVSTLAGNSLAESGRLYEENALYAEGDYADGDAMTALFDHPAGLTVTSEGGIVIADTLNHSVRYLYEGKVITLAGERFQTSGETNGIDGYGRFSVPTDVVVMHDGRIIVADSFNNKLRQVSLYTLPAEITEDSSIKVVYDQTVIAFETAPVLENGRTMVPVRAIAEALGYQVTYTETGKLIQLKRGNVTIEMAIDEQEVRRLENGIVAAAHQMDAAPYLKGDFTYVPVRFFAEEIGLDVQWNSSTHTAIIRNKVTK